MQAQKLEDRLRNIAELADVFYDGENYLLDFGAEETTDLFYTLAGGSAVALQQGDDLSTRVIDASIVAVGTQFSFNGGNATLVSDDVVGNIKLSVERATVTRITADLAQSLLDGKPTWMRFSSDPPMKPSSTTRLREPTRT